MEGGRRQWESYLARVDLLAAEVVFEGPHDEFGVYAPQLFVGRSSMGVGDAVPMAAT